MWNSTSDLSCALFESNMNLIICAVFLISYILFYGVFNGKLSVTEQEVIHKRNKAEKYLTKHLYTDQQFFCT